MISSKIFTDFDAFAFFVVGPIGYFKLYEI